MPSYDANQRSAVRLVCAGCLKGYDVTHAEQRTQPFRCVWCAK
jgi:hypothetical protein